MRFFISIVPCAAVLLSHSVGAQNFYHSEGSPPVFPGGPGGSPGYGYAVPPPPKPSRPSFFRNPLAAASNLHKTVIAGIRAPAFLSNLLPSASAPRPSIFSFAKPPRGAGGPSGPGPSFGPSFAPESSASSHYPSFFGRPSGASGPSPHSYYSSPSSDSSGSPFAGLPPNVISALQNGQFDGHSMSSGSDQQEAATSVHEISGSPYDRAPPRIRPGYGSSDDSEISSASGIAPTLSGASSSGFDPSSFASQSAVAQSLLAQQSGSAGGSGAPSQIAGYDIGVPVQLGFQTHSTQGQSSNSVGPAYQIDTSSLQYPSSYQQQVSGHSGQAGSYSGQAGSYSGQGGSYSGLATGYGSGSSADSGKQQSGGYGQGQTYVVGSSLSYDGKSPSTSYASSGPSKPVEYGSQGGYAGYSSGQGNEALVQALKAYANGNVKYVPGKPAVPINHQLPQSGHATSTSYSTSSSTSSSSYASPVSAKSTKYATSSGGSGYSTPVKSASSYSSPVKASPIRYSSNSGGLSYAESAPQAAKYGQKAASFESTRTVGSSLKFGDSSGSSAGASSSSSSSSSSSAAASASKKSS